MSNQRKRVIVAFSVAAVAAVLGTAFLFSPGVLKSRAEAVVQEPLQEEIVAEFRSNNPEKYVSDTGKSAVKISIATTSVSSSSAVPEKLSVKRGESITIQVEGLHLGGSKASQNVNVELLPPVGYILYPPSAAEATTPEQRYEGALKGTPLPGGIDLGSLVTISGPSEKSISKASTTAFDVSISIPKDLSAELDEIFIPINVRATDDSGNDVLAKGTGVTVVVS